MQLLNIMVSLGGDDGNTVSKFGVTPSEVAVLQGIHGEDAVKDIEVVGSVERTSREERARLFSIYAKIRDGKDVSPLSDLFPGVAARLFETIDELGLDESFFKANSKPQPEPVAEPAAPVEEVKPKGKRGGKKAAVPPVPATPAAEETDEDEGVGDDIRDEHAEKNVLG
jgi:hypothetical protein